MTHSSSLSMLRHSLEPKTRKYVKGYGFLSFTRNLSNKYGKQLSDAATKIGLDPLLLPKNCFQKKEFIKQLKLQVNL